MNRELVEIIAYAIAASKKGAPVESIFTVAPTDTNGYLAAYISTAIGFHLGPKLREAGEATSFGQAVKALPSVCWWSPAGHPVFNNCNGDDLILRKDVLNILRGEK